MLVFGLRGIFVLLFSALLSGLLEGRETEALGPAAMTGEVER